MSVSRIAELRRQRQAAWEKQSALSVRAAEEDRLLTADEQQEWDKRDADMEALGAEIERLEKLEEQSRRFVVRAEEKRDLERAADRGSDGARTELSEAEHKAAYSAAFYRYAARGLEHLSWEDRELLRKGEVRVQTAGTGSEGGYTVPEEWRSEIELAVTDFSGVLQSGASILTTSNGREINMPTVNDTSNSASLEGEGDALATTDFVVAEKLLNAYIYSSDFVKCTEALLEDTEANLPQFIGRLQGERIGRALNTALTTGTGSGQPNGVVTASSAGKTAAATGAITYLELIDLKHSVDPGYRQGPSVGWMFNDSTFKAIKQLLDADNRPIWRPNVEVGAPPTLDGDRYTVNQAMDSLAAAKKVVLYGDFSKYIVRRVRGVTARRLNELFMGNLLVGFIAFLRADGELLNAGVAPIKHLITAAS